MTRPLPTGMQLTVLDPDFRDDPYPILADLRERAPIHHDEELGRWIFTRHRDVNDILRNPKLESDPRKANPGTFTREFLDRDDREPSMLLMDDPEVHPDPDCFDIERDPIQLQAFGGGNHFCLGAHLARLEAAETFAAVFDRFPSLEFSSRGHRYASNPSFRGMSEFWVSGKA